jgi:predicted Rossmann fold flavoprotein
MEQANPDLVVVGAGAAGLWAAARVAEAGLEVLLLEKNSRAGTKILLSGGTRCNLTTTLSSDEAARSFGVAGERFLRRAFRALPPGKVRERFLTLGVPTVEASMEKVFPESDRARDVRDALFGWAGISGVRFRFDTPVEGIRCDGERWCVRIGGGEEVVSSALLLATGGASYPRCGTTGDGFRWLEELGLTVVPPVPALVPLTSDEAWVHELTGIAIHTVGERLIDGDGRVLLRRERPILFTHQGLSGPGALDVSHLVARAVAEAKARGESPPRLRLLLDLVPRLDREALRTRLIRAAGASGNRTLERLVSDAISDRLPRRVVRAACLQAGLATRKGRAPELSRQNRHELVEVLKGLEVPLDGTLGFDRAEVTAGGLELRSVDPGSMEVRGRRGLHVVGELLDIVGPIGGLNFQAAFATADAAARHLIASAGR